MLAFVLVKCAVLVGSCASSKFELIFNIFNGPCMFVDQFFNMNKSLIKSAYHINCLIHMELFYNVFMNYLKHQSFCGMDF